MTELLQLNFSHRFDGLIWSTIASPEENLLVIEVRDPNEKQVSFSALNIATNLFLWRNRKLEEPWWVNASAIVDGKLIFTVYMDTNNPDKKGIVVYDIATLSLVWWKNDFSISEVTGSQIKGFTSKLGLKHVMLDVHSGNEEGEKPVDTTKKNNLLRPVQYPEGIEHFQTVKRFLADRLNLTAVSALEYLEIANKIIISCYVQETDGLANNLLVFSFEGENLLREKLDGPVKGIGLDTFFILNGFLIFVKNKVELVSYKIL